MSLKKFTHRLASGGEAVILRLDAARAEILPLFERPVSTPVEQVVRRLGEARFGPTFAKVPLSGLHSLRLEAAAVQSRDIMINGGYFLFDLKELGPFDRFGDPIGLVAEGGEVCSPPLFGRAALVRDTIGWRMRRLNSTNCTVADLPIGAKVFFADHTRQIPAAQSPATDVILHGRRVVAHQPAQATTVPYCGCIIRLPEGVTPPPTGSRVTYLLDTPVQQGIQAGPILVSNGVLVPGTTDIFLSERLGGETPPYGWHANWRSTRAARLAAGIDAEGGLFFCAVEGGSSLMAADGKPAQGATLADMAALMVEFGAHDAINLDGGGSVQVFGAGGGSFLTCGELYQSAAFAGATYERGIPTALKLNLK